MKNLDELKKAIGEESIRLSNAMGKEMNEYKGRVLALYGSEEELDEHINLAFAGYIVAVSKILSYVAELQATVNGKCDRKHYVQALNRLSGDIRKALIKSYDESEK